jgi:hypothetical protein
MVANMILNLKDFEETDVSLNDVFLDPNNPRFFIEPQNVIPDNKFTEALVQEKCMDKMKDYEIDELKESVKSVGFLQIDKVVVRPLDNKKYVVVEGNRRIAALKILKKEVEKSETQLRKEIVDSLTRFKVVVYKGKEKDIAWIVQGIRHISGVRNWPAYQQAEILMKIIQEKKVGIREASNALGIGPKIAGRLVRAYHGLQQAKDDDEYGQNVFPSHFAYFMEAVFSRPALQNWLSWNETSKRFENITNLKKLLSWITEPEEGKPKVGRAIDLRDIVAEAVSSHPDLMKRFENEETMTVEKLNFELGKRAPIDVEEWLIRIKDSSRELKELSSVKIMDKKTEFIEALEELDNVIRQHVEILKKMSK